jgi:hypothetical protein
MKLCLQGFTHVSLRFGSVFKEATINFIYTISLPNDTQLLVIDFFFGSRVLFACLYGGSHKYVCRTPRLVGERLLPSVVGNTNIAQKVWALQQYQIWVADANFEVLRLTCPLIEIIRLNLNRYLKFTDSFCNLLTTACVAFPTLQVQTFLHNMAASYHRYKARFLGTVAQFGRLNLIHFISTFQTWMCCEVQISLHSAIFRVNQIQAHE